MWTCERGGGAKFAKWIKETACLTMSRDIVEQETIYKYIGENLHFAEILLFLAISIFESIKTSTENQT